MKRLQYSYLPQGNAFLGKTLLLICFIISTACANMAGNQRTEFGCCPKSARSRLSGTHHHRVESSPLKKQRFRTSFGAEDNNRLSLFTSLVAIEVQSNHLGKVLRRARNAGFRLITKVFKDEDIYLLRHENPGRRRFRRSLKNAVFMLYDDSRIKAVTPQYAIQRHKRSFVPELEELPGLRTSNWTGNLGEEYGYMHFNDPLYKDQWYLVNRYNMVDPFRHDINVLPVWRVGINGSGVRISVLDDGVYMWNQEVSLNYEPAMGFDFINFNHLRPEDIAENSHGTYCAAIAAGVANNKYCGVGVAYGAQIGGPRVLDGLITDVQEAMALNQALDYVDIYTASWGPHDDGKRLEGPGPLARMAFMKGVTKGRQGLGAIYVWAAGNGGRFSDNCNADGYASSPLTLTFGAVTDKGLSTYYSEPCAAVIASMYVGGSHHPPTMENIEELRKKIKVVVPEAHGRCRETFQGTSAAAPMAAGVIALVLQANSKLSWRDVEHIIVECSRIPSWREAGWSLNAAGKHFHLKMGFGVLNAAQMVATAKNWKYVSALRTWTSKALVQARRIKPRQKCEISLNVHEEEMDSSNYIGCLENVIATVNVTHPRRRDLELFLISPGGTVSQILTKRSQDDDAHIIMWNFTTLHFWGETPFGKWRLQIMDTATFGSNGFINYFALSLLGTSSVCLNQVQPIRNINTKQIISLMQKNGNLQGIFN